MNYRELGNTGLRVSEIGFGAWGIGGPAKAGTMPIGWADWDLAASKRAIERSVELGITFFDTADFYGFGKSEELLGEVLGGRWNNLVVATKVGHVLGPDGSVQLDYTRSHIIEACDQSLRRLKKDVIDVYQLHSAKLDHLERGECIEAMEELKRKGKVRAWGISLNTFAPEREGTWILDHRAGDTLQLVLNIVNQKALQEVIPRAQKLGYGIIARMPLQFGLLTGKFSDNTRFDPADHRSMRLPPQILERGNRLVARLTPIAERMNISLGALALKFVLGHDSVSTVIPGIKNEAQAEQNASASGEPHLSREDVAALHALYEVEFRQFLDHLRQAG
jgi:aryl-alcohol dehydrogenase-like predicted oxidoreductase